MPYAQYSTVQTKLLQPYGLPITEVNGGHTIRVDTRKPSVISTEGFSTGGANGTRTRDPHTASVVRYQLRHSPRINIEAAFTLRCGLLKGYMALSCITKSACRTLFYAFAECARADLPNMN